MVSLAASGMHTAALGADDKVATRGANGYSGLSRDGKHDGRLRDIANGEVQALNLTETSTRVKRRQLSRF
ncbi:hypothetical protein K431DRAFT_283151, partial [Polychaeton citri CBS 116435]